MIQNYLHIMEESLQKKDVLLDKITDVCERQEVLLKEDSFSLEEFDKLMETKGKLAEELNRLDDGFESLYEKVREQLWEVSWVVGILVGLSIVDIPLTTHAKMPS